LPDRDRRNRSLITKAGNGRHERTRLDDPIESWALSARHARHARSVLAVDQRTAGSAPTLRSARSSLQMTPSIRPALRPS